MGGKWCGSIGIALRWICEVTHDARWGCLLYIYTSVVEWFEVVDGRRCCEIGDRKMGKEIKINQLIAVRREWLGD